MITFANDMDILYLCLCSLLIIIKMFKKLREILKAVMQVAKYMPIIMEILNSLTKDVEQLQDVISQIKGNQKLSESNIIRLSEKIDKYVSEEQN